MKKKNTESIKAKSKWRFSVGDYFIQTILIIISVLLAFILNEYRENLREDQVRDMALQEVKIEIESNLETLERWLPYHETLHKRIGETISNGDFQNNLLSDEHTDFSSLFDQGIFRELLSQNAWLFIQQNGIKLEYEQSSALNFTYLLQEEYFLRSIEKLANLFFQRETLNPDLLHETLVLMHRLSGEIIGQEQTLIMQYKSTLDVIQN